MALLLLYFLLCPLLVTTCPLDCVCGEASFVNCSGKSLKYFPEISFGVKTVLLNNNKITSLQSVSNFSNFSSVKIISLNNNLITKCDLSILPSNSIEELYLDNNQITEFSESPAIKTKRLRILSLSGNQLSIFSYFHFSKLEELILSSNKITTLYKYRLPKTLLLLDLHDNPIIFIHPFISSHLFRLQYMNMMSISSCFHLPLFNDLLMGKTHLRILRIGGAKSGKFHPSSFTHLNSLLSITLNNLSMSSLPSLTNSSLLTHVNLHNNNLTIFPSNSLKGLKLVKKIDLSFNFISSLNNFRSFAEDNNLTIANFSHNLIISFDSSYFNSYLQILDLSFNKILYFQANEFKNQIIQINLTNNLLFCNQDSFQVNILPLISTDYLFSFYYQNNSIRCNETKQIIRSIKQKTSIHLVWLTIIPIFIIFASFTVCCIKLKTDSKNQIGPTSSINHTQSANEPNCSTSDAVVVNDTSNTYENSHESFNQVNSIPHSRSCYMRMNRFPTPVSRSVSHQSSSTQNNQNLVNFDYANVTFNAASNRDVYLVPMPTVRGKKRSPTYAEIVN